jgi:Flp pilus assembly pilin Flp
MRSITRFIEDDNGADLVEYALLVGLVSLALVGTLPNVATAITNLFGRLIGRLDAQLPAGS